MWDTSLQISFAGSFLMKRYTDPEARGTLNFREDISFCNFII